MSAVEDTRVARERAHRLLAETRRSMLIAVDRWQFARLVATEGSVRPRPVMLPDDEQATMQELRKSGLVESDRDGAVSLTKAGNTVLGAAVPPESGLLAPPPLLCDSTIHEPRPAVVMAAETTGSMRRMAQCADCAQHYTLNAASLAVARFESDPSAPPVAIHLIPLPRPGSGGL